jgi:hypothetical protein
MMKDVILKILDDYKNSIMESIKIDNTNLGEIMENEDVYSVKPFMDPTRFWICRQDVTNLL